MVLLAPPGDYCHITLRKRMWHFSAYGHALSHGGEPPTPLGRFRVGPPAGTCCHNYAATFARSDRLRLYARLNSDPKKGSELRRIEAYTIRITRHRKETTKLTPSCRTFMRRPKDGLKNATSSTAVLRLSRCPSTHSAGPRNVQST